MAVLLISSAYYPNVGGVETHLKEFVEFLEKRGVKTYVLTFHPKSMADILKMGDLPDTKSFERDGIIEIHRVNRLKIPFVFPTVTGFITFMAHLPFFLLKHRDVKVIHAHCSASVSASVLWGRILFKKAVFYTQHTPLDFHGTNRSRVLGWCLRRCDALFGITKSVALDFLSFGVPKEKTLYFKYWVDLDKFTPIKDAKKRLGLEGKFVVHFSGRFFEVKGVRFFADACQRLKDSGNYYFIATGSGPLESYVRERVDMVRLVSYDEIPLYYSAADLFVIPSNYEEGFGKVTIEALACGTPVIGSNVGGIPEAIDDTVGVLVQPGSVEELVKAIRYYHDNPAELEKLRNNARPYAEKNYSERNAESILERYRMIQPDFK